MLDPPPAAVFGEGMVRRGRERREGKGREEKRGEF